MIGHVHEFVFINSNQCTEVRFASFLSSEFITAIVVNPPERKLAKRTSVCNVLNSSKVLNGWLANNWAPGLSKNESCSLNYLQTNESFAYRFSWFVTLEIFEYKIDSLWIKKSVLSCALIDLSDLTFKLWADFSVQLESHCYFRIF